jgi:orotate phosphoribosyltransferase
MIWDAETALKVAEFLLRIKAVRLKPDSPFTWASGWNSPIYCDNRLTLSYPDIRTYIRQHFVKVVEEKFGTVDSIAGVATGGIALGVLVAQEMGVPFCYVRSSAKGHGMQNRIEGQLEAGQSVVVIEDLISTGSSSLSAVEALRETGAEVKGLIAIFSYGFKEAEEAFEKHEVPYFTLSNYEYLLKQALNSGMIGEKDMRALESWRESPSTWKVKTIGT